MTKIVMIKTWDKDNPEIYFEYELQQKDFARSSIVHNLERLSKKESDYITDMGETNITSRSKRDA